MKLVSYKYCMQLFYVSQLALSKIRTTLLGNPSIQNNEKAPNPNTGKTTPNQSKTQREEIRLAREKISNIISRAQAYSISEYNEILINRNNCQANGGSWASQNAIQVYIDIADMYRRNDSPEDIIERLRNENRGYLNEGNLVAYGRGRQYVNFARTYTDNIRIAQELSDKLINYKTRYHDYDGFINDIHPGSIPAEYQACFNVDLQPFVVI